MDTLKQLFSDLMTYFLGPGGSPATSNHNPDPGQLGAHLFEDADEHRVEDDSLQGEQDLVEARKQELRHFFSGNFELFTSPEQEEALQTPTRAKLEEKRKWIADFEEKEQKPFKYTAKALVAQEPRVFELVDFSAWHLVIDGQREDEPISTSFVKGGKSYVIGPFPLDEVVITKIAENNLHVEVKFENAVSFNGTLYDVFVADVKIETIGCILLCESKFMD